MSERPIAAGDVLRTRAIHISRADLATYADASGDHNPIHADDEAARAVGLPGVVAHGMLTLGLAMSAVADWAGPGCALSEFGARFVRPVPVPADTGADLSVGGRVTAVDELGQLRIDVDVTCGGEKVLAAARAIVRPA